MQTVQTVLLVLQVLVALALIVFILIQHGKGADAGAAFGSGASATMFGARGSGNFLTRATTVLAFLFLANSLALAYIARERIRNQQSLMEQEAAAAVTVPAERSLIQRPADTTAQAPASETPASDVPMAPEQSSDVPVAPGNP